VILKIADFFKRTFFFGWKANVDSIESNKTKKKGLLIPDAIFFSIETPIGEELRN